LRLLLVLLLTRRTDRLGRELSRWALRREALSWRREPSRGRRTVVVRRAIGETVRTSWGTTEARVALRRRRVSVRRERWGLLRALGTLRTAPLLLLLLLLLVGLRETTLRAGWRGLGSAVRRSCGL
jgi:hypothetical protein